MPHWTQDGPQGLARQRRVIDLAYAIMLVETVGLEQLAAGHPLTPSYLDRLAKRYDWKAVKNAVEVFRMLAEDEIAAASRVCTT